MENGLEGEGFGKSKWREAVGGCCSNPVKVDGDLDLGWLGQKKRREQIQEILTK